MVNIIEDDPVNLPVFVIRQHPPEPFGRYTRYTLRPFGNRIRLVLNAVVSFSMYHSDTSRAKLAGLSRGYSLSAE